MFKKNCTFNDEFTDNSIYNGIKDMNNIIFQIYMNL